MEIPRGGLAGAESNQICHIIKIGAGGTVKQMWSENQRIVCFNVATDEWDIVSEIKKAVL